jgi:hypothetical protein
VARGWESKSVEDQKLAAEVTPGPAGAARRLTPEERAAQQKRNVLAMNRARVAEELARCANPRFLPQLRSELSYLDAELEKLGG